MLGNVASQITALVVHCIAVIVMLKLGQAQIAQDTTTRFLKQHKKNEAPTSADFKVEILYALSSFHKKRNRKHVPLNEALIKRNLHVCQIFIRG